MEANQRFELVTSDGAAVPATVPLLLSGPTPLKVVLIWLSNDDDDGNDANANASNADTDAASAAAPTAKRPRGE